MEGQGMDSSFADYSGNLPYLTGSISTLTSNLVKNETNSSIKQDAIPESELMNFLPSAFSARTESSESESSLKASTSFSTDIHMSDHNNSSISWSFMGSGNSPLSSRFQTDSILSQMTDYPLRPTGHRRAFSDFHVRDIHGFKSNSEYSNLLAEQGVQLSNEGFLKVDSLAENELREKEVDNTPSYHSRSLSVDDGLLTNFRNCGSLDSGSPQSQISKPSKPQRESLSKKEIEEMDGEEALKKVMASKKMQDMENMDPKRAKRILANRQSAARSKERKTKYISELEEKVSFYEKQSTTLKATLALLQKETTSLAEANEDMSKKLQLLDNLYRQREVENKQLLSEVEILRQITQLTIQSANKTSLNSISSSPPSLSSSTFHSSLEQQLLNFVQQNPSNTSLSHQLQQIQQKIQQQNQSNLSQNLSLNLPKELKQSLQQNLQQNLTQNLTQNLQLGNASLLSHLNSHQQQTNQTPSHQQSHSAINGLQILGLTSDSLQQQMNAYNTNKNLFDGSADLNSSLQFALLKHDGRN